MERTLSQLHTPVVTEQRLLFTEDGLLPDCLPHVHELRPSYNLSAVFDDCHNYVYANEGLLKEKIFHEIVKLLVMKLYDERTNDGGNLHFGITSVEYKLVRANAPNSFEERMSHLFNTVRDQYQYLFSDSVLKLKALTLAYIVGRLQYISLTNTPGDIKGEAFQTFVYRHQRGDRGEFFTPYSIVRLAVEMIAPQPREKLIDPACGSGGFLIEAISYIQRNFPDINKAEHIREFVCGMEFNPDIALAASIRITFNGGRGTEIICANTLSGSDNLDGSFDVVLTNPPFGNKGRIEDHGILKSYILARKWEKLSDNMWEPTKVVMAGQSPDVLFVEKCLRLLKPGGRMAIVLPEGLLQNISSGHIRFWIRTQADVLGVVSIPQEAFVPYGTGIKTSLMLLQKHPSDKQHHACFMARMQKVGYDVKGQATYKRNDAGKLLRDTSGASIIDDDVEDIVTAYRKSADAKKLIETDKVYSVPKKLLDSRLDAEHYRPDDLRLIEQLQAGGAKPLGEISDILNETADFRLVPDGEIRYIAISDVDSRTMQVVSQQIIKAYKAPSRATYRVHKGDVITAISGASTGTRKQASAVITEEEDGAICSNGFAVIRNIREVNALFLLAYMRTEYYLRQVRRLMTGHAIPAISTEDLSRVLVPIPPKDEQEKIVEAVVSIQTMRREASRIGEKLVAETEQVISRRKRR
jgi:type I restriction enzyme M protein